MKGMIFQYILTWTVLAVCTYTDIKERKIYRNVITAYFILALIGHIFWGRLPLWLYIAGVVPGLISVGISALTHQAVGYGDSFLILTAGFSLGIFRTLSMLYLTFFCVGVWAVVVIFIRRKYQKKDVPFVPFLLVGTIFGGIW